MFVFVGNVGEALEEAFLGRMWLRTERRYAEGNEEGLGESIDDDDDDDDEWDGSESEREL